MLKSKTFLDGWNYWFALGRDRWVDFTGDLELGAAL